MWSNDLCYLSDPLAPALKANSVIHNDESHSKTLWNVEQFKVSDEFGSGWWRYLGENNSKF